MDERKLELYYAEADPVKRKIIFEKILEEEGDTSDNQIRKELFAVRYAKASQTKKEIPADGYLALWMALEYNVGVGGGLFGLDIRRAQKEIRRHLEGLKIAHYLGLGGDYERLQKEELCHMVRSYMTLCKTDRSYNSTLFGLMKIGSDNADSKLKEDIRAVATFLPQRLHMEEELAPITEAARIVYEEFFPYEGGL